MEWYVDEGFRAVRQALGDGIELLLDANNKWRAFEAIRFGRAVEKYDRLSHSIRRKKGDT